MTYGSVHPRSTTTTLEKYHQPMPAGTAPAVIRTAAFTVEIADSISDRLLSAILREVSHI